MGGGRRRREALVDAREGKRENGWWLRSNSSFMPTQRRRHQTNGQASVVDLHGWNATQHRRLLATDNPCRWVRIGVLACVACVPLVRPAAGAVVAVAPPPSLWSLGGGWLGLVVVPWSSPPLEKVAVGRGWLLRDTPPPGERTQRVFFFSFSYPRGQTPIFSTRAVNSTRQICDLTMCIKNLPVFLNSCAHRTKNSLLAWFLIRPTTAVLL